MVHENDVKFVVPRKYINMSTAERSQKIQKALDEMKARPRKAKSPIKNKSVTLKY